VVKFKRIYVNIIILLFINISEGIANMNGPADRGKMTVAIVTIIIIAIIE